MLWFFIGAFALIVSVGIKLIVSTLACHSLEKWLSHKSHAMTWGFVSAFCELGLAAFVFFFLLPDGSLWNVIVFGIGAGGCEAVILFGVVLYQKDNTSKQDVLVWHQRWTFVIERTGALLIHIGSRGLVWLGVHGTVYPLMLGMIIFASVDGVATYGVLDKWDWLEYQTWKRFYAFVIVSGVLDILLFIGTYYI